MPKKGTTRKTQKSVYVRLDNRKSRFVVDLKERLLAESAPRPSRTGGALLEYLISKHRNPEVRSLAVFGIFILAWKAGLFSWRLFYKLCYSIGWLTVFSARFLFLLLSRISGPLIRLSAYAAPLFKKAYPDERVSVSPFSSLGDAFHGFRKKRAEAALLEEALRFQPVTEETAHLDAYGLSADGFVRSGWKALRQTLMFGLALAIMVIPLKAMTSYGGFSLEDFKGRVLGASEEGARDFLSGSESIAGMDFQKARNDFSEAGGKFLAAKNELDGINVIISALALVLPDKKIKLAAEAEHILTTGQEASALGNNLSLSLDSLVGEEKRSAGLKEKLDGFIAYGEKAADNAENMKTALDKINLRNLPSEYQEQFVLARDKTGMLAGSLREFMDLAEKLKDFLGASQDKRYLLVFQNNSELRATGGFIGSFALVDFRDGKLKNIEVPGGGSYDTEAGLKMKITAPEPLHLVNPLWHFWDANWWPDWPTSARKLEWFYEKSDGPTVDGVLSFTPTVLEDILRVIGPVDMTEKYGLVITAENFWLETQRLSERKPEETKEPKKIVGDLMSEMLEELPKRLDKKSLVELLRVAQENLDGRQMLFYFNDKDLERKTDDFGWNGAMKKTSRDFLSVVNTNIAGGKSDRSIEEIITHRAEIGDDGSVIDTVEIQRGHTGWKTDEFSGARNVDWMRVYVPLGSKLLEASGFAKPDEKYFSAPDPSWETDKDVYRSEKTVRTDEASGVEIYEENGYTVFAGWSMTDPGHISNVVLKYRLPFVLERKEKEDDFLSRIKEELGFVEADIQAYSLLVQKQAGAKPSRIESALTVDGRYDIVWSYADGNKVSGSGWQVADGLDRDKYWAVLLEKVGAR